MKDELETLYEAVRNPKTRQPDSKKNTVGTVTEGDDFGFEKKGVMKGTGPENVKGVQKPKEVKANQGPITEEMEKDESKPEVGLKFDKLFSQTLSEEFGEADASDTMSDEFSSGSDFPDDSADSADSSDLDQDEDSGSLKSEIQAIIDHLQSLLDKIGDDSDMENSGEELDHTDADIEDLNASAEENQDRTPIGEDADPGMDKKRDGRLQKAPDGSKALQGKNNKVSGYFGKNTMGGGAKADAGMDKPRDGVLRPAPDGSKSLQGKNNKVSTSSVMSKPGASLFD